MTRLTPPEELLPVTELVIELPDNEFSRELVDALRSADDSARTERGAA